MHRTTTAALVAVVVAVAGCSGPTPEEQARAEETACLLTLLASFGGPELAALTVDEGLDPSLYEDVTGDLDGSFVDGLASLSDAGPEVEEAIGTVLEHGRRRNDGGIPTAEETAAYTEAMASLVETCDSFGLNG